MDFQKKLETYAELLVCHGLNVQPGQVVNITAEIIHREVVEKIVKAAYRRGAKYVNVDFVDPKLAKLRIQESQSENFLQYVPRYVPVKYDSFVDEGACVLRLTGSEFPDILADLPANKVNEVQKYFRQSIKKYYSEGVGKSKLQWTVAAAATPKWAKKIFPELDEQKAYEALWDAIFTICRADKENCLELWKKHNQMLKDRAQKLTDLKIEELHFTGPGTDLKVYLSPKAKFKGGGDSTPQGYDFEANIPTEECFTTPDYRKTEGRVRITRPVLVNGEFVKDLELTFSQGVITHFQASLGQEQFGAYINNDEGANRLGEVSLVGIDSPIYQSKRVFQEILFDENAACHIAVGMAYRFCIDGGTTMTEDELKTLGVNDSSVHTDFMISSEEVSVRAKTYDGKELQLLEKGKWA
jgi:aminopeptidase